METLTGFWNFREEFEYGQKHGELRLFHTGDEIWGTLIFREVSDAKDSLFVRCQIVGSIKGNAIQFRDVSHVVLIGGTDEDYMPEERQGVMNINGQFVGTAIDKDNVEGVFVIEKSFCMK